MQLSGIKHRLHSSTSKETSRDARGGRKRYSELDELPVKFVFHNTFWWLVLTAAIASSGVAAHFGQWGPNPGLPTFIFSVLLLSVLPYAVLIVRFPPWPAWFELDKGKRLANHAVLFYSDVGIAVALATLSDPIVALHGTALFALVGVYAAFFASTTACSVHVTFVIVYIVGLGAYASDLTGVGSDHELSGIIARATVSVVATVGSIRLLLALTRRMTSSLTAYARDATTDSLTGLLNRRGFLRATSDLLATSHDGLVIVAIDVDNFKKVNDEHGHKAGDDVLRLLSNRLAASVGPTEILGRLGGEEFVIAVNTRDTDPRTLSRAILRNVHDEADSIPITVSIGVGDCFLAPAEVGSSSDEGAQESVERIREQLVLDGIDTADASMYMAKRGGRNRVFPDGSGPSNEGSRL